MLHLGKSLFYRIFNTHYEVLYQIDYEMRYWIEDYFLFIQGEIFLHSHSYGIIFQRSRNEKESIYMWHFIVNLVLMHKAG